MFHWGRKGKGGGGKRSAYIRKGKKTKSSPDSRIGKAGGTLLIFVFIQGKKREEGKAFKFATVGEKGESGRRKQRPPDLFIFQEGEGTSCWKRYWNQQKDTAARVPLTRGGKKRGEKKTS